MVVKANPIDEVLDGVSGYIADGIAFYPVTTIAKRYGVGGSMAIDKTKGRKFNGKLCYTKDQIKIWLLGVNTRKIKKLVAQAELNRIIRLTQEYDLLAKHGLIEDVGNTNASSRLISAVKELSATTETAATGRIAKLEAGLAEMMAKLAPTVDNLVDRKLANDSSRIMSTARYIESSNHRLRSIEEQFDTILAFAFGHYRRAHEFNVGNITVEAVANYAKALAELGIITDPDTSLNNFYRKMLLAVSGTMPNAAAIQRDISYDSPINYLSYVRNNQLLLACYNYMYDLQQQVMLTDAIGKDKVAQNIAATAGTSGATRRFTQPVPTPVPMAAPAARR